MAAPSTQDEDLTCSVCLEIFTNPKILQRCLHTFCETCLQAVIDKSSEPKFPCPSCREEVQVPVGDASSFKRNPYIKETDLENARRRLWCTVHAKRVLELFCEDCDRCICVVCKVMEHQGCKTEIIQKVVDKARAQLSDDRTRLDGSAAEIKKRINEVEEEERALKTKQDLLAADIHSRHAAVVAAADKIRDEALATLTKVMGYLETKLATLSAEMKKNLAEVETLHKQAKDSQDVSSVSDLLRTAREMRAGSGSNTAIQKLVSKLCLAVVARPVLQCEKTDQDIVDSVKAFVGTAVPREMEICKPDVEVKEHINCSNGKPDCQVFSLCPVEDENVWVCYALPALSVFTCPWKFDKHGKHLRSQGNVTAEINFKYAEGHGFNCKRDIARLAKSDKLWSLFSNGRETINVQEMKILSKDPFKSHETIIFTIQCGKHRACDIDSSDTWVAVVEEAQNPDTINKVKLFQRPANSEAAMTPQEAVDTYKARSPDCFQPMDVCFYTLGSKEFLLVADELDAIHVLRVISGRFEFVRYLNPTCPLIVRPTAMNVDPQGRLWVACQGGRILICTPRSP